MKNSGSSAGNRPEKDPVNAVWKFASNSSNNPVNENRHVGTPELSAMFFLLESTSGMQDELYPATSLIKNDQDKYMHSQVL